MEQLPGPRPVVRTVFSTGGPVSWHGRLARSTAVACRCMRQVGRAGPAWRAPDQNVRTSKGWRIRLRAFSDGGSDAWVSVDDSSPPHDHPASSTAAAGCHFHGPRLHPAAHLLILQPAVTKHQRAAQHGVQLNGRCAESQPDPADSSQHGQAGDSRAECDSSARWAACLQRPAHPTPSSSFDEHLVQATAGQQKPGCGS